MMTGGADGARGPPTGEPVAEGPWPGRFGLVFSSPPLGMLLNGPLPIVGGRPSEDGSASLPPLPPLFWPISRTQLSNCLSQVRETHL